MDKVQFLNYLNYFMIFLNAILFLLSFFVKNKEDKGFWLIDSLIITVFFAANTFVVLYYANETINALLYALVINILYCSSYLYVLAYYVKINRGIKTTFSFPFR